MSNVQPIQAAGAVLWRLAEPGSSGRHAAREEQADVEVAILHRDRYDDWSLPKGKLDDGETLLACAVREIAEETGAQVTVEQFLTRVHYEVAGTAKQVDYWSMRYRVGDFKPNDETDELRWLSLEEARALLTYPLDRDVLDAFEASPRPDAAILLIRHAKAGKRSQWTGSDADRPLESAGQKQARRLVPFARRFGPQRLITANRTRCAQTLLPLSEATGQSLLIDDAFNDEAYVDDPKQAARDLLTLASPESRIALCSQGTFIPGVLDDLVAAAGVVSLTRLRESDPRHPARPWPDGFATSKGAAWLLCFREGELVGVDYYSVNDI